MIDGSLHSPWPPEVTGALEKFKQGDLMKRPPFLYAADLSRPLFALTQETAERDLQAGEAISPGVLLSCEADDDSRPPYGIITTQTCDLVELGDTPAQPWFQVAPVYSPELEPEHASKLLGRQYIVELDGPSLGEGIWVADLRIEVPLEKSALVDREPIAGFSSEDGYLDFAQRLGVKRARAALADILDRVIVKTLRRKLERDSAGARLAREWTYSIRIGIVEGERLDPSIVKVYPVLKGPADGPVGDGRPKVPEGVLEWYARWWQKAHEDAAQEAIRLLPNEYLDAACVDAGLYDRLIELDVSHLISPTSDPPGAT